MRKELKQVLVICGFFIIGCVLGYFVAVHQINLLSDPAYIASLTSQNMAIPEPLGFTRSILSFWITFFWNTYRFDFLSWHSQEMVNSYRA